MPLYVLSVALLYFLATGLGKTTCFIVIMRVFADTG